MVVVVEPLLARERVCERSKELSAKMEWKTRSALFKHNNLLPKIAVAIFLAGFAFKLLYYRSPGSIPNVGIATERETETDPSAEISGGLARSDNIPRVNVSVSTAQDGGDEVSSKEKCDLFTGDWILYPSGPVYTNASCPFIDSPQNCMKNGRPDTGYLYWRWNPRQCELPPFDPGKFLDLMRNKAWALIGDSISRNHVQSLLCMLARVERPEQVYHDEEYKSRRWIFRSYNFTLSVIWSPFLAKAAIFENFDGVSTSEVQLHLDVLDKNWTFLYPNLDYMIISTGQWFLKSAIYYENDTVVGCHNCNQENVTEVRFDLAYKKTLHNLMNFIATSKHRGTIFFRISAPDHFENGEWHNGGTCKRTTPVKDGEIELKDVNRILRDTELSEFNAALENATKNGVDLRLLDFTKLMLTRPDGHPGPYRSYYPFAKDKNTKVQNDCLHWCLPGPIDYWNDVIMEMVVNPSYIVGTNDD